MKTILTAEEVAEYVQSLHWNYNAFGEGDLLERIYKYSIYKLQALDLLQLDTEEWYTDEETIVDYQQQYQRTKQYPPIVYDAKSESIIDGTHRAKALKLLGLKTIMAYVGQ